MKELFVINLRREIMKTISKEDTDLIAEHLYAARNIVRDLEKRYNTEISFNKMAPLYCDSMFYAIKNLERVWNNT